MNTKTKIILVVLALAIFIIIFYKFGLIHSSPKAIPTIQYAQPIGPVQPGR